MSEKSEVQSPPLSLPAPGENHTSSVVRTEDDGGRDIVEKVKKKTGIVKQRNYVLNDVGALKKKLKHENKKQEIVIGKEARDGSNVTVPMRASFFEFVKFNFIQEIENNDDIVKIENAEGVKAPTETSGEAFVEYSMDITFKVKDSTHTVKITAYTTSSQLMVQPVGEKAGFKDHLGNKGTPRFFVEKFLLPWSEKSIREKRYNESTQKVYLAAIKEEIKKLDLQKLEMKKTSKYSMDTPLELGHGSSKADVKCAAKICNFQGLNPLNKAAVGTCANCGNCEHFACVKIKPEHKEDITKGIMKYYCTACFSKNPSNPARKNLTNDVLEIVPRSRHRLDSLPVMGQGYLPSVSKSLIVTPLSTEQAESNKKCGICDYESDSIQDMIKHNENNHKPECTTCVRVFSSSDELQDHNAAEHCSVSNLGEKRSSNRSASIEHIEDIHTNECVCQECTFVTNTIRSETNHTDSEHTSTQDISCPHCDYKTTDEKYLTEHIKQKHNNQCEHCDQNFTQKSNLLEHQRSDHVVSTNQCMMCKLYFATNNELERHIKEEHSQLCEVCEETFATRSELVNHVDLNHSFKCNYCEIVTTTMEKMGKHVEDCHTIQCNFCSFNFPTNQELELHKSEQHPYACVVCSTQLDSKSNLEKHLEDNHTYTCDSCGYIAINEDIMENHILDKHAQPDTEGEYKCDDCDFKTEDKQNFGKHYKDNHGSNSTKQKDTEVIKIREEYRILKNNFDRLESMYRDALDELNTAKADYEARLQEATDMYRAEKSEKEVLEEKVDVLFKLGRSYINAKNNHETNGEKSIQSSETNNDDIIEIVEVHEKDEVNEEDLVGWTKNKMRGFKRTTPAAEHVRKSPTNSNTNKTNLNKVNNPAKNTLSPGPEPNAPSRPGTEVKEPPEISKVSEKNKPHETRPSVRYCHFFVNQGRCNFEERTGSPCKFVHEIAPMCNSGIRCSRPRCMFSHPKMTGSKTFLERNMIMNPWQMMNPWLQAPPNQFSQNPLQWNLRER